MDFREKFRENIKKTFRFDPNKDTSLSFDRKPNVSRLHFVGGKYYPLRTSFVRGKYAILSQHNLSAYILPTVERLYCKRPILCLASSKILTPQPPHRPASVYTLAFGARGGHTRWVERGVGVNILEDARHSSVLYICKYFVLPTLPTHPPIISVLLNPD
jgi:hypothetical protein